MVSRERERALRLAERWEREAYDFDRMADRPDFTTKEVLTLRQQALTKRACARDLRAELSTVPRGR